MERLKFGPRAVPGTQALFCTICRSGELILWQVGMWTRVWTTTLNGDVSAMTIAPTPFYPYLAYATVSDGLFILRTGEAR